MSPLTSRGQIWQLRLTKTYLLGMHNRGAHLEGAVETVDQRPPRCSSRCHTITLSPDLLCLMIVQGTKYCGLQLGAPQATCGPELALTLAVGPDLLSSGCAQGPSNYGVQLGAPQSTFDPYAPNLEAAGSPRRDHTYTTP